MSFKGFRRAVLAMVLVAPVTAAHPATPAPAPALEAAAFAGAFAAFGELPSAAPVRDAAVDITAIEHSHPGAGEADEQSAGTRLGSGSASYYAAKFQGRRTASGEAFDNSALTAAHRTLPFGSKVRVTNPATGNSVVVRINDRGPFHKSRLIDVSRAAAQRLGLIANGHGKVELALID